MGQLREVYDGYLRKETGLGKTVEWGTSKQPNRSVFIMASTEAIYKVQEKFSEMGSRGLNYVMHDADRIASTLVAMRKSKGFDAQIADLQVRVANYVAGCVRDLPAEFPELDPALEGKIAAVSEFVTRARSIVTRDFRGQKQLALSAEMPMRVATQLQTAAKMLIHLNGGRCEDWITKTIMKCALDCIPKQSNLVLRCLAQHAKANTGGVAQRIGYPEERCTEWLENLNMHGVVDAHKSGGRMYWSLREDYRTLLAEQLHLEKLTGSLEADGDDWAQMGTGNYAV